MRKTIFHVEDDATIAGLVNIHFDMWGYDSVHANSVNGAIELYEKRHEDIDAALLDVNIVGGTSDQVYSRMLEIKPIPTVVYTGNIEQGPVYNLRNMGVLEVIKKPVQDWNALERKFAEALALQSQ